MAHVRHTPDLVVGHRLHRLHVEAPNSEVLAGLPGTELGRERCLSETTKGPESRLGCYAKIYATGC